MSLLVTSKNVSWPRLIWPILYITLSDTSTDPQRADDAVQNSTRPPLYKVDNYRNTGRPTTSIRLLRLFSHNYISHRDDVQIRYLGPSTTLRIERL